MTCNYCKHTVLHSETFNGNVAMEMLVCHKMSFRADLCAPMAKIPAHILGQWITLTRVARRCLEIFFFNITPSLSLLSSTSATFSAKISNEQHKVCISPNSRAHAHTALILSIRDRTLTFLARKINLPSRWRWCFLSLLTQAQLADSSKARTDAQY